MASPLRNSCAQVAVGFERAELAPLVVLAVREHHIDGHERSGIVVRRVRQAAAGLNGVVFDAARRDGARRTRAHVPVLVHRRAALDQLPVQRGSLASEAAVRRQVRRLPCTLVVRGREIVRTAAGRPETTALLGRAGGGSVQSPCRSRALGCAQTWVFWASADIMRWLSDSSEHELSSTNSLYWWTTTAADAATVAAAGSANCEA